MNEKKTIVRLGSTQEEDSSGRIPAFFIVRPAQSEGQAPQEDLLISLNLPLERVNQELDIFNRFILLWEEYARDHGYEFDYDKNLYEKTSDGWRVIED